MLPLRTAHGKRLGHGRANGSAAEDERRMQDYEDYDAIALAALVREGEVTPSTLLDAAIERCEKRNATVNAVVIPMLEQVLVIDPNNREARQLLMNALGDGVAAEAAAGVLEPRLREARQWTELVAVLAAKAKVTTDLGARARVLEAMGDVYLTDLESPQKAFAAYARALDDDSAAHDILAKLGRAASAIAA